MAHGDSNTFAGRRVSTVCTALLLSASAVFLALHFVHLTADFPNYSPWMDWAKYTDEGWYGDAAIRHYQLGHWYVPGDFNPAAALPVWPVLELVLFRFTGVSLVAARALTVTIFALILLAAFFLLRRWLPRASPLVPAGAVLLLAVSPFCFVFTRMAILEPLLVLWMLLALLAASAAPHRRSGRLALGLLLPVMVLTKTTAVFLFPAVFWLLWASAAYRLRPFARAAFVSCATAVALWLTYFAAFIRPYFLADYRYLFSANAYTGITAANAATVLTNTLNDGMWMGHVLYPLSLAGSLAALLILRRRISPLSVALLLWIAGYAGFLAYHNNLQPRYYLVAAVPMTLLLPLILRELAMWLAMAAPATRLAASAFSVLAIAAVALPDALQTLRYVSAPEYTFAAAAANLKRIVAADPSRNSLVLSISGSELSLMTGLPSICDDFGTMELAQRVETYRPGWYAAWNQVDDDKMEALAPLYRLVRVAAFPAFDAPERNLLILYRLDPHDFKQRGPRRHKPVVPRLLETHAGQQPTAEQLEH